MNRLSSETKFIIATHLDIDSLVNYHVICDNKTKEIIYERYPETEVDICTLGEAKLFKGIIKKIIFEIDIYFYRDFSKEEKLNLGRYYVSHNYDHNKHKNWHTSAILLVKLDQFKKGILSPNERIGYQKIKKLIAEIPMK